MGIPQSATAMNERAFSRACPICDGPSRTILHTQRFALSEGHPLQSSYDFVACSTCGFCFADTAVSQPGYDAYYARMSKYADAATSTGAGVFLWDTERLEQITDQVSAFAPDRAARLLDIGCANGGLLAALRARGFANACGMDPSTACVAQARKTGAGEAWVGTLSDMPAGIGRFDGIVLSHVLEHVRDLCDAMERVRQLLNPGGWVYIEVPDAARYEQFLVAPFQDFNTEHINHFSQASLANLCRRLRFMPVSTGAKTVFSAQDVPYAAVYWFARKTEEPVAITRDDSLRPALEGYIRASRDLMTRLDRRIRALLGRHPELIVWGTGQLTMKLLVDTCLRNASIVAFVDGNPVNQGQLLRGRPVIDGSGITNHTVPILVCSLINSAAIIAAIRKLGLTNPVVTLAPAENEHDPPR